MVRVCPVSRSDATESSSFLKVDPRKKQVTIMDPSANQTSSTASQKKAGANQVPPKMFSFDAAFPPDASQVREKSLWLKGLTSDFDVKSHGSALTGTGTEGFLQSQLYTKKQTVAVIIPYYTDHIWCVKAGKTAYVRLLVTVPSWIFDISDSYICLLHI